MCNYFYYRFKFVYIVDLGGDDFKLILIVNNNGIFIYEYMFCVDIYILFIYYEI